MDKKKLAYQISTALVILLFTFAGVVKVTRLVSLKMYNEMQSKFSSYVTIPPFNLIRLDPNLYMLTVGLTELACALIIAVSMMGRKGVLATWVLFVIMLGALYTLFMVGGKPDEMVWAFFGLIIVLVRLYTLGAFRSAEIKIKV